MYSSSCFLFKFCSSWRRLFHFALQGQRLTAFTLYYIVCEVRIHYYSVLLPPDNRNSLITTSIIHVLQELKLCQIILCFLVTQQVFLTIFPFIDILCRWRGRQSYLQRFWEKNCVPTYLSTSLQEQIHIDGLFLQLYVTKLHMFKTLICLYSRTGDTFTDRQQIKNLFQNAMRRISMKLINTWFLNKPQLKLQPPIDKNDKMKFLPEIDNEANLNYA